MMPLTPLPRCHAPMSPAAPYEHADAISSFYLRA